MRSSSSRAGRGRLGRGTIFALPRPGCLSPGRCVLRLIGLLTVAGMVAAWSAARIPWTAQAGEVASNAELKVLSPIQRGNLTVFPVVASKTHDTREFLTLDEGLKSGEVVVTEMGQIQPMMRRRQTQWPHGDSAQVNRLVLVNNSQRPLLLLAGEIVTGGKQDRVIGKDRIVPAESDPIDLGVFCVEPGRWVAASGYFENRDSFAYMAAPAVRKGAMADKDQQKVWTEVGNNARQTTEVVAAQAPAPLKAELGGTTSYARVQENKYVKQAIDSVAAPLERNYSKLIRELKDRDAVGVVVAVNGQIIWADIFASTELLEKYWPKLVRSYAAEAVATRSRDYEVSMKSAQAFLDALDGKRETVEREPGLYRHSEITGDGYKVFELTALLPKTGFTVHTAKMAN